MNLRRSVIPEDLMRSLGAKIRQLSGDSFCVTTDLNRWQPRCLDELPYIQKLYRLRPLVRQGRGILVTADVHSSAVCWRDTILPSGCERLRKSTLPFWADTVRMEHRFWSAYSHFASWHNNEAVFFGLRLSPFH